MCCIVCQLLHRLMGCLLCLYTCTNIYAGPNALSMVHDSDFIKSQLSHCCFIYQCSINVLYFLIDAILHLCCCTNCFYTCSRVSNYDCLSHLLVTSLRFLYAAFLCIPAVVFMTSSDTMLNLSPSYKFKRFFLNFLGLGYHSIMLWKGFNDVVRLSSFNRFGPCIVIASYLHVGYCYVHILWIGVAIVINTMESTSLILFSNVSGRPVRREKRVAYMSRTEETARPSSSLLTITKIKAVKFQEG